MASRDFPKVANSSMLLKALLFALVHRAAALAAPSPYQVLRAASVIDPLSGKRASALAGINQGMMLSRGVRGRALVVVLPQLGEFDSAEYCEQLVAVLDDLKRSDVSLRIIGIGDAASARRFATFSGLPLSYLRADPDGALHAALGLHDGPRWGFPDWAPDFALGLLLRSLPGGPPADRAAVREVANAWLRYLAMCAGLGAPGTLTEILRGYVGDRTAPERLAPDGVVTAGFVRLGPGVGPVEIGPIRYDNAWKDERGYQRPVELATVRLRNMVEVLSNWGGYVTNPTQIARRGATYVFEPTGEAVYEYKSPGVLTYSESMPRPLSFLVPYIGEARARNPLGLGDTAGREA